MSDGLNHRIAVLVVIGALAACGRVDDRPAVRLTLGVCVPDSVEMGGGDTLTTASQRAIYDAVLDSLRNLYGSTALYLDPRVETVGRDVEFTRLHESVLLDHLMASERFGQMCQADDGSRCDVDSTGVNVRFSGLLRVKGTDRVLVDVTQQTVRPMRDSSDWYFWASWVRFWVEREGRCWTVASTEVKGMV
jgi:hypothetical protein